MVAASALAEWVQRSGRCRDRDPAPGRLRFAFYGRVSTEDWQDPATSRTRQREQAGALVRGHGQIVAEFFDVGQTRKLAWACRPQSAALVAQLADPDRGWDAIVIGEYERAFYGSQYAAMAPLFEHYGVQLWTPEAGGRVDFRSEHDEKTMTMLGLPSKREITRTSIRVRTAMAVQTREQGRYLGGRPPYGYRLADAGPHPNKAHAAWGRRAHRLEPGPRAAPVVRCFAEVRPRGGGTLVITGSHRVVARYAASLPPRQPYEGHLLVRYLRRDDWFRALSRPGDADPGQAARFMDRDHDAGGIAVRVAELTGQPGDVVLTHPWVLHSGSCNTGSRWCGARVRVSTSAGPSPAVGRCMAVKLTWSMMLPANNRGRVPGWPGRRQGLIMVACSLITISIRTSRRCGSSARRPRVCCAWTTPSRSARRSTTGSCCGITRSPVTGSRSTSPRTSPEC
jgi:DNA invertase Pin-like site-specific DNA recombinase